MAFLQDPRQRNFAAPASDSGLPVVGGGPQFPNPVATVVSATSAPRIMRPGQAAPDVNPLPLGTRAGAALRDARQVIGSAEVAGLNGLSRGATAVGNVLTSGARAAGGFLRDAGRAAVGAPALANAGQPLAPLRAPQLAMPKGRAPVMFQTDAPATQAALKDPNFDPAADNISASNLAAASAWSKSGAGGGAPAGSAKVAPSQAAPQISRNVTALDGRVMRGGALVGGVPTFSDGSANTAATLTKDQIGELGKERNLSRADAGVLSMPLASDALGTTASTDQMANRRLTQLTRPVTGSRPTEAQFAAADRNAVASGDWRSAAGTAASNLRTDAAFARTPRLRRVAEEQIAALGTGAQQAGALAQQGEQQKALAGTQAQNALDLEAARGSNELANTALQQRTALLNQPMQQVNLADGTIAFADPRNRQVLPSIGPDGNPAKALVTRDDSATRRSNEIQDQLNRGAQELLKAYLPTKDAPTPPPEFIAQAREQSARAMGLRLGTDEKGRRVVEINGQVQPL